MTIPIRLHTKHAVERRRSGLFFRWTAKPAGGARLALGECNAGWRASTSVSPS
ncbi:hypothetical protein ACIBBB_17285 [Streptomyces sp. NPDC051217]|uniref:hypothetical protein n=1 Tax=Streptomyces sp. NPDC051217 TaxID=3365644 RepID=UPI0037A36C14